MNNLEELELRSTIERREAVIKILESDLFAARREIEALRELLGRICREELYDRCGPVENCENCPVKKTLERTK